MRASNYPFLADLIAISTRWMALLGLTVALGIAGELTSVLGIILGVLAAWNFFVSILALVNRRLAGHRIINLIFDLAGAAAIFIFSGGVHGPVVWAGVLALFSASIYYELRGGLLVGVLITLVQSAWIVLQLPDGQLPWQPLAMLGGLNIGSGIVLGIAGMRLVRGLRHLYQKEMTERKETVTKARLQERNRIQTLYEMTETLSTSLNYQVVLDNALDLSSKLMEETGEGSHLVSMVLLFEQGTLKIGSSRRLSSADNQSNLPGDQGVLAEAIRSGSPQHIQSPAKDPELSSLMGLRECASAFCLPLMRGMSVYGLLLYAHPTPTFFTADRREVLEMVGHHAVIAIQNASLYQDLEHEKQHILETQEEARKTLARNLHDGPTQSVSAIAMRLSIARRLLENNKDEAADELAKIEDLARRTIQEIRHMLFTLRPLALESEGLVAALTIMAEKMQDVYQQKVVIRADQAAVNELDLPKQTVVFYLAEEAVNNARKHAKATELRVLINYVPQDHEFILLEIADNGVGFDVKAVNQSYERRGSLGMVNLRERADMLNGSLNIHSTPGRGTRVRVLIPVTEQAVDRLQRGLMKSQ